MFNRKINNFPICLNTYCAIIFILHARTSFSKGLANSKGYSASLALEITSYSIASAVTIGVSVLAAILAWHQLVFLFLLVLEYKHMNRWLTRRVIGWLLIVPILSIILALTNEWHGLIWLSLAISGILFAWGIFYVRMLEIVPLARDVFIKNMVDGVLVLNTRNLIMDVNPAAQAALGLEKASLIGKSLETLAPDLSNAVKSAMETSVPKDIMLSAHGITRVFDLDIQPLAESTGKPLGNLIVLRDITGHKPIEESPRESEECFHQLAEIFPEIVFESDLNGRLTYLNARGMSQFCVSTEDIAQGINLFDFIVPEDRAAAMQRIQEHLTDKRKQSEYVEYQAFRKDGKMFYAIAYATPILYQDHPTGIRGFILNITARKLTEESLRESEAQLRALIDYSPVSIIKFSAGGDILLWNAAAEKMYGWTAEEVLGKQLPTVPSGKEPEKMNMQTQVNQGGRINYTEVRRQRKDGSLIDIGLSVAPLYDAAGQINAQMSISIDITERKLLQDRLQQQATIDELSGFFNRRHFLELAQSELKRAVRLKHPFNIVLIDLDYFKTINDTFGHEGGDQAIRIFAAVCRKNFREIDIIARFGGDEFVIILPEVTSEQAVQVMERLRMSLKSQVFEIAGKPLSLTISAGIAALVDVNEPLDSILKRADEAMYQAKTAGRDRVYMKAL